MSVCCGVWRGEGAKYIYSVFAYFCEQCIVDYHNHTLILILILKMVSFQLFLIHLCKCVFRSGQQPHTMGQVVRTNNVSGTHPIVRFTQFRHKIQSVTVTSPMN